VFFLMHHSESDLSLLAAEKPGDTNIAITTSSNLLGVGQLEKLIRRLYAYFKIGSSGNK